MVLLAMVRPADHCADAGIVVVKRHFGAVGRIEPRLFELGPFQILAHPEPVAFVKGHVNDGRDAIWTIAEGIHRTVVTVRFPGAVAILRDGADAHEPGHPTNRLLS